MTKNFKREEFACKCGCGEMRISPTVVLVCQMVRDHFKKPVKVTSGCRCKKHNEAVGGVPDSQHSPKGDELTHASDIQVEDVSPMVVSAFLDARFPNTLGIGTYKTFTHVDDRMDRAYRWSH